MDKCSGRIRRPSKTEQIPYPRLWCGRGDIGLHYEETRSRWVQRCSLYPTASQAAMVPIRVSTTTRPEQQGISPDCLVVNGVAGNKPLPCNGPSDGSWCYRDGSPLMPEVLPDAYDHSSGASRCGLSLPLFSRMWCGPLGFVPLLEEAPVDLWPNWDHADMVSLLWWESILSNTVWCFQHSQRMGL